MSENLENVGGPSSFLGSPQFSEMLGKVLSNSELMGALRSAVSSPTRDEAEPVVEASTEAKEDLSAADDMMKRLPEIMSVLGPVMAGKGGNVRADDKRSCLLRAIKPYVNDSRKEAIEYMIKFSAITEVLKKNGGGGRYV